MISIHRTPSVMSWAKWIPRLMSYWPLWMIKRRKWFEKKTEKYEVGNIYESVQLQDEIEVELALSDVAQNWRK